MAKKISTKVVLALHMGVPIAIGRGVKSGIVLAPHLGGLRVKSGIGLAPHLGGWGVKSGRIELLYH